MEMYKINLGYVPDNTTAPTSIHVFLSFDYILAVFITFLLLNSEVFNNKYLANSKITNEKPSPCFF